MASNYKNNGDGTYTIYGNVTFVKDFKGNTISKTYVDCDGIKRTENYSNGKHMSTTSTYKNGQTMTTESSDAFRERMRIFREKQQKNQTSNNKLPPCMAALMGRTISATPNRKKK